MILFKIAFRNILKNGRRSLFTVLAVSFGFAAVNLFQGYVHNTYELIRKQAIHGEGLGHLTVFKKGFLKQGKIHPSKYIFQKEEMDAILQWLRQDPEVAVASPRLDISGLVSNGRVSVIFWAKGMVPSDQDRIRGDVKETLLQGKHLHDGRPSGAVVSSGLAEMLDLKVGDTAVIVGSTLEGMTNALDIQVAGLYDTMISATNDMSIQLTLEHAQNLYDTHGADRVSVLLRQSGTLMDSRSRITQALGDLGIPVEVKTWEELSLFYRQTKETLDTIFFFINFIVLVIAVMSIVNTMSMSIIERTREIGTMRALGLKRANVLYHFGLEGVLLGVLGCGVGLILFFGVLVLLRIFEPTYMAPSASNPIPLAVDVVASYLFGNGVMLALLAWVSAIVPARKASRMNIVDSMGHI